MEIKIDRRDYLESRIAEMKMTALEWGGVDNWQWYSESLSNFKRDWIEGHKDWLKKRHPDEDYDPYLDGLTFEEMAEIELEECF